VTKKKVVNKVLHLYQEIDNETSEGEYHYQHFGLGLITTISSLWRILVKQKNYLGIEVVTMKKTV